MISPTLLRQFPHFNFMDDAQLHFITTISNEIVFEGKEALLEAGDSAEYFYIVVDGRLALYDVRENERDPRRRNEYFVAYIGPGEPAGLSALIPPHIYGETVRADKVARVIQLRAEPLLTYCKTNFQLAGLLYADVARSAMKQTADTCKAWIRGRYQVTSV